MTALRPHQRDEPTLRELLEAARLDCPEPLRRLLATIVRTAGRHEEWLLKLDEAIRDLGGDPAPPAPDDSHDR